MKNVHLIPTENQHTGCLSLTPDGRLSTNLFIGIPHHIYITSEGEPVKKRNWVLYYENKISKVLGVNIDELKLDKGGVWKNSCKKIVLTSDPELIKDGVQAIDDEFLEYLIKNPTCELVGIEETWFSKTNTFQDTIRKIIYLKPSDISDSDIPKEETLEEAAKEFVLSHNFSLLTNPNHLANRCFQFGAKWQAEQDKEIINSLNNTLNKIAQKNIYNLFKEDIEIQIEGIYTNEEVIDLLWLLYSSPNREIDFTSKEELIEWFKQIKKK